MIKEYFTDGLIGIAILLSLLRTDLISINNIINYPEVQDIILGQTAAYLPTNFHHIHSSVQSGNPKHLDLDYRAFNAWFHNTNNLALFRDRRGYNIDAFLVSAFHQNVGEQQVDQTIVSVSESNNILEMSLPSLPEENANSFTEEEIVSVSSERSVVTIDEHTNDDEASSNINQTVNDNIHVKTNSTASSSNLTKEDLKLIDILYQQDVDLGVGKEIFDPLFREELEREQELEFLNQQEKQKAELLAKEKEEQEKKEQKDRWLKKHFKRDGETGEWVQNGQGSRNLTTLALVDNNRDDAFGAALDFTGSLSRSEDNVCLNDYKEERVQPQRPLLIHQDSFHENWNGLVDFLNMTASSFDENGYLVPSFSEEMGASSGMNSDLGLEQSTNLQTDFLIQNVTLPASIMDMSTDFNALIPPEELNASMPFQSANLHSMMEFDLGELSFFGNLTSLQNTSVDEIDLAVGGEIFQSFQEPDGEVMLNTSLAENMHAMQELEDSQSIPNGSFENTSLPSGLNDTFDGLEGATGGSDYSSNYEDMNERFSKVARCSESSNDSGFAYQHGFSSPSSSASSSYAGSPAGSHGGINSTAFSNGTGHDPHDTCSIAHQHVAHNHTYNTLPGHVPREVKKYSQKMPSRKGPQSRDQRRAEELKVPFAIEDIIESSVETFNEMLATHKLNDAQLTLIKDIRRRGKNKVAAQNCRKRKVSVIFNLADEMTELQKVRDRLVVEQAAMEREKRKLKEKFGHLYTHIFQSLRDERGEPYDPNFYSLQQSSDGNVFLVPRNLSANGQSSNTLTSPSSSSSSKNSTNPKKRKFYDN